MPGSCFLPPLHYDLQAALRTRATGSNPQAWGSVPIFSIFGRTGPTTDADDAAGDAPVGVACHAHPMHTSRQCLPIDVHG